MGEQKTGISEDVRNNKGVQVSQKKKTHINKNSYSLSFIFLYLSGMILSFSMLCSKQRYDHPDFLLLLPLNSVIKIKTIYTAYLKSDIQNTFAICHVVHESLASYKHQKRKEKIVICYPNLRCVISKAGKQTLSLLKSLWVYICMTYLIRS